MSVRNRMEQRRILEREFCKDIPTASLVEAKRLGFRAIHLVHELEQLTGGPSHDSHIDPDTPAVDSSKPGEDS